jgi:alkylation response protein AidB-like acyl-CoA dehydrogenase
MNLLPTDEQESFAAASAGFLAASLPLARVRSLIDESDNVDAAAWAAAADLGWFGLGLPEALGGVGAGLADEALLFRELGRALAPGPFLAMVLGARVAAIGGAEALAAEVVGGTRRVGYALDDQLLDGVGATHAVVVRPERAELVDLAGVDITPGRCLDDASRIATAAIAGARVVASVTAETDPVFRRVLVLTAAAMVGIGEATRDMAADYAKTRVQFDRPIGVHQGVKHPCADMAVRCEGAWAQTVVAALAHDEALADADREALCARVVAEEAAERNSTGALQVLGGIGYTAEHDIHLYVKRTHVLRRIPLVRKGLLDLLIAC